MKSIQGAKGMVTFSPGKDAEEAAASQSSNYQQSMTGNGDTYDKYV